MLITRVLSVLILLVFALPALAKDVAAKLRRFEGYTIVAVSNVTGAFEGCDFGRVIKLDNGMTFRCNEYNYSYSYSPSVVVFAKKISYQVGSFAQVVLLIEDEVYEMAPTPLR